MLAGRQVFDEPGFLMAWMSGDPALVRMWMKSEGRCAQGCLGHQVGMTRSPNDRGRRQSRAGVDD